jgi:antitoxin MazE
MKTAVQQWGNSLGIRVPRHLADEARIKRGSPVDVKFSNGELVITPVAKRRVYSLDHLVQRISARNLHKEISMGRRAGREVW